MIHKNLKERLIKQIDVIFKLNDKLADFYKNPNKISQIRNKIFIEIGNLKILIQ